MKFYSGAVHKKSTQRNELKKRRKEAREEKESTAAHRVLQEYIVRQIISSGRALNFFAEIFFGLSSRKKGGLSLTLLPLTLPYPTLPYLTRPLGLMSQAHRCNYTV